MARQATGCRSTTPSAPWADAQLLHGAILIYSYTLAESQAADYLARSTRDLGGIEDRAHRLMRPIGQTWDDVLDDGAGLVEAAVVRNALAHGVPGET